MAAGSDGRRARAPDSTAGFLRRGLDLLRDRDRSRYDQVRAHLLGSPGRYRVGAEQFTVQVRGDRVFVRKGRARTARIDVETSALDILRLMDGTSTMVELLGNDLLRIRADADSLLDLSSAVRAFFDAAVGCPPLHQVFEDYRTWVLSRRSLADARGDIG
jgi:hypothetical protein